MIIKTFSRLLKVKATAKSSLCTGAFAGVAYPLIEVASNFSTAVGYSRYSMFNVILLLTVFMLLFIPSGLFVLGREHFKLNPFYAFTKKHSSEFGSILGRSFLYLVVFTLVYSLISQFTPGPHLDDKFRSFIQNEQLVK